MESSVVSGLAELDALLKQLPARIEGNVLRGGLRVASAVMVEKAKAYAPVKSGDLRDSIRASVRLRKGVVTATITAGNKKAYYAHMVEFGTLHHFIKPKDRRSLFFAGVMKEVVEHPGSEEKPFMRPALDEGQQEAIQAMADYIRTRLPKEFTKQARLAAAEGNE